MEEENKGQEPEQELEQELEPVQGEEPAQEPEEAGQTEKPDEQKGEGLLMPVLYALLAGVGAFTLALIAGIVLTFFFQPAEPAETPSTGPSSSQAASSPVPTQTQEPEDDAGGNGADDGGVS